MILFLKNNFKKYEIVVISNGSLKNNINLLKQNNNIFINHLYFEQSGKGFAVREGIKNRFIKFSFINLFLKELINP